MLVLVN